MAQELLNRLAQGELLEKEELVSLLDALDEDNSESLRDDLFTKS